MFFIILHGEAGEGTSTPRRTNELVPTPLEILAGEAHTWLPWKGLEAWGDLERGERGEPCRTRSATPKHWCKGAQSLEEPPNYWLEGGIQSQTVLSTLT